MCHALVRNRLRAQLKQSSAFIVVLTNELCKRNDANFDIYFLCSFRSNLFNFLLKV